MGVFKETAEKDPSFRISVCLSRFFDDVRARCYMSVQGRRRVRWLQRRLRRLYALPRGVCLLSRGHLLPPDEPLALLRPDDLVEVIPLPTGCNWVCNEGMTTIATDPPELNEVVLQQERKKQKKENKKVIATATCSDDASRTIDCDVACQSGVNSMPSKCDITNEMLTDKDRETPETCQLDQVKEHALDLLKLYEKIDGSQSIDSYIPNTAPRHRVRRRVRRRRPPALAPCAAPAVAAAAITQSESAPTYELQSSLSYWPMPPTCFPSAAAAATAPALAPATVPVAIAATAAAATAPAPATALAAPTGTAAAAVVRNDAAKPRAARLVRPLDEPCNNPVALTAFAAGLCAP